MWTCLLLDGLCESTSDKFISRQFISLNRTQKLKNIVRDSVNSIALMEEGQPLQGWARWITLSQTKQFCLWTPDRKSPPILMVTLYSMEDKEQPSWQAHLMLYMFIMMGLLRVWLIRSVIIRSAFKYQIMISLEEEDEIVREGKENFEIQGEKKWRGKRERMAEETVQCLFCSKEIGAEQNMYCLTNNNYACLCYKCKLSKRRPLISDGAIKLFITHPRQLINQIGSPTPSSPKQFAKTSVQKYLEALALKDENKLLEEERAFCEKLATEAERRHGQILSGRVGLQAFVGGQQQRQMKQYRGMSLMVIVAGG